MVGVLTIFLIIGFQSPDFGSAVIETDPYEPNDSMAESYYIAEPGYYSEMKILNEDWYKFIIDSNEDARINIYYQEGAGLSTLLYDENGTGIAAGSQIFSNEREITWHNPSAMEKTFYLQITGNHDYWYNLDYRSWFVHPMDDSYEYYSVGENDYKYSATYIDDTLMENKEPLINWDDDWYNLDVMIGDNLTIDLYSSNDTEFTLSIFDSENNLLQEVQKINGDDFISAEMVDLTSNSIYFKVSGDNEGKHYHIAMFINGDDRMEDNDFRLDAHELYNWDIYDGLIQKDNDWYSFYLYAGDFLEVKLFSENNELNLSIWDSNNILLTNEDIEEECKYISWNSSIEDDYYILIEGDNLGEKYCLDIRNNGEGFDDFAEENDFLEEAYELDLNSYTMNLELFDDDWYIINVDALTILDFHIYGSSMDPWIVDLYNSTGDLIKNLPIDEYGAIDDNWTNIEDEIVPIYLCVHGAFNGLGYSIELYDRILEIDDEFEENDEFSQAYFIESDQNPFDHIDLRLYDDDWFMVTVEPGNFLNTFVYFNDTQDDVWLYGYDGSYGYLIDGFYDYQMDAMVFTWKNYGSVSENFHIQISGNHGATYSLCISEESPHADDDWFEPNNIKLNAANLLLPFFETGLQLNDPDWYEIWLEHNDYIDLSLKTDANTDIFVEIYDSMNVLVIRWDIDQYGDMNNIFTAGYSDYYYILIASVSSQVWYDMQIDLNGQSTNTNNDDWAEENDIIEDAKEIFSGYHSFTLLDDDWFKVDVNSLETIVVELYSTDYQNLNLEIYNTDYSFASSSWDIGNGLRVEWINQETQSGDELCYIHINGNNANLMYYDLSIWYDSQNQDTDDWLEENDDYRNAVELGIPNRWDDLVNLDDDFYEIKIEANKTAEINLYCGRNDPLWLEDVHPSEGYMIRSDSSTEDGLLQFDFYTEDDGTFMFAVKGDNTGIHYSLDIFIIGEDHPTDDDKPENEPSLDWAPFQIGDWIEYDVSAKFDDDGGPRGEENYNGSVRIEIKDMGLDDESVWVEMEITWDSIPAEFQMENETFITFHIYEDGFVENSYFGFVNFFMGKGFLFSENAEDWPEDYRYEVRDNGLTLELEASEDEEFWYRFEVKLTEDRYLEYLMMEGDMIDDTGVFYGKGKLEFSLSDYSIDTSEKSNESDDDPFSNMDLSSIPGFPMEFVSIASVCVVGMLFIFLRRKMKK